MQGTMHIGMTTDISRAGLNYYPKQEKTLLLQRQTRNEQPETPRGQCAKTQKR